MAVPVVNGFEPTFADIEVNIDGIVITDISEISYKTGHQSTMYYGTSRMPIARTKGQNKAEGSLTMLASSYYDMVERVGDGYLEKIFNITVNYAFDEGRIITDELEGCTMQEPEFNHSSGDEPLTVSISLSIWNVKVAGKNPYAQMPTGQNAVRTEG